MNSLIFFLTSVFVFMYVGRRTGWTLSRSVLYPAHAGITALVCIGWGIAIAYVIHALIAWQHPNIVVQVIFGFLLGAYVAIPNYGLVAESTIPPHAMPKHNMIYTLPLFAYIASSIAFAWLT